LGFYGPAKPGDFAEWAGLAKPHAQRLWDEAAGDLAEVRVGESKGWLMREDVRALESRARSRSTSVAKGVAAPSRCALWPLRGRRQTFARALHVFKAPRALAPGVIPADHPAVATRIELDAHPTTLNGTWGSRTLPHDV
jgi:hypothetical protein